MSKRLRGKAWAKRHVAKKFRKANAHSELITQIGMNVAGHFNYGGGLGANEMKTREVDEEDLDCDMDCD